MILAIHTQIPLARVAVQRGIFVDVVITFRANHHKASVRKP